MQTVNETVNQGSRDENKVSTTLLLYRTETL